MTRYVLQTSPDIQAMDLDSAYTIFIPQTRVYRIYPLDFINGKEYAMLLAIQNGLLNVLEIERRRCISKQGMINDHSMISCNNDCIAVMDEVIWILSRLKREYLNDSDKEYCHLWEELYNTYSQYVRSNDRAKYSTLDDLCDRWCHDFRIFDCRLLLKVVSVLI